MRIPSVEISIGAFIFRQITAFEIDSSWDNLTDTATITFSNSFFLDESTNTSVGLNSLINRGDPVLIKAGYREETEELPVRFMGFVSDIKTGHLIEVFCQDAMYALKQKNVTQQVIKNRNAQEVIDIVTEGLNITKNVIDTKTLGIIKIANNSFLSVATFLDQIKQTYGFAIFFKGTELNVGNPYTESGNEHFFLKQGHIIEDNLESKKNDEFVVLKGISKNYILNETFIRYVYRVGEKIEISETEVPGNSTIELKLPPNMSVEDIEESLTRKYQKLNSQGLEGSFKIMGEPFVQFNDYCTIRDLKDPERDTKNKVKRVVTTFSTDDGLKQDITIDFSFETVRENG